jgi:AcrR family transcriptional regulator
VNGMNKTKRKIFETSMKLFSEKGYDATSIEEITATVGVAKGTLYYHFSSKEEIFNFLVEEGMKLLKNSIEIKTSRCETTMDKLRAVSLVQLKVLSKYENLLTIVMSQTWGNEPRNLFCKTKVLEHIEVIEKIINEGQERGDFFECNSALMASEIFSLTCSTLLYLRKTGEKLDIQKLYKEYEKTLFEKLEGYKGE